MIVYIDSFSGDAAELKPKDRTIDNLIKALKKDSRVSYWDISENRWLRALIKKALKAGLIEEIHDDYPWIRYKTINKGKK